MAPYLSKLLLLSIGAMRIASAATVTAPPEPGSTSTISSTPITTAPAILENRQNAKCDFYTFLPPKAFSCDTGKKSCSGDYATTSICNQEAQFHGTKAAATVAVPNVLGLQAHPKKARQAWTFKITPKLEEKITELVNEQCKKSGTFNPHIARRDAQNFACSVPELMALEGGTYGAMQAELTKDITQALTDSGGVLIEPIVAVAYAHRNIRQFTPSLTALAALAILSQFARQGYLSHVIEAPATLINRVFEERKKFLELPSAASGEPAKVTSTTSEGPSCPTGVTVSPDDDQGEEGNPPRPICHHGASPNKLFKRSPPKSANDYCNCPDGKMYRTSIVTSTTMINGKPSAYKVACPYTAIPDPSLAILDKDSPVGKTTYNPTVTEIVYTPSPTTGGMVAVAAKTCHPDDGDNFVGFQSDDVASVITKFCNDAWTRGYASPTPKPGVKHGDKKHARLDKTPVTQEYSVPRSWPLEYKLRIVITADARACDKEANGKAEGLSWNHGDWCQAQLHQIFLCNGFKRGMTQNLKSGWWLNGGLYNIGCINFEITHGDAPLLLLSQSNKYAGGTRPAMPIHGPEPICNPVPDPHAVRPGNMNLHTGQGEYITGWTYEFLYLAIHKACDALSGTSGHDARKFTNDKNNKAEVLRAKNLWQTEGYRNGVAGPENLIMYLDFNQAACPVDNLMEKFDFADSGTKDKCIRNFAGAFGPSKCKSFRQPEYPFMHPEYFTGGALYWECMYWEVSPESKFKEGTKFWDI